jgi:hypothetical protein
MPTNQLRPAATSTRSAQITEPRCKVCQHPRRLDIEVALLEGQSRQLVAERFSTSELPLNRQNLHVHNQKHMDTVDRAVVDKARADTKRAARRPHRARDPRSGRRTAQPATCPCPGSDPGRSGTGDPARHPSAQR